MPNKLPKEYLNEAIRLFDAGRDLRRETRPVTGTTLWHNGHGVRFRTADFPCTHLMEVQIMGRGAGDAQQFDTRDTETSLADWVSDIKNQIRTEAANLNLLAGEE